MSLARALGLAPPSVSGLDGSFHCWTFALLSVKQRARGDAFQRAPALAAVRKLVWLGEQQRGRQRSSGGKGCPEEREERVPAGSYILQPTPSFCLFAQKPLCDIPTQILGVTTCPYLYGCICPCVHMSQHERRLGDNF